MSHNTTVVLRFCCTVPELQSLFGDKFAHGHNLNLEPYDDICLFANTFVDLGQ